jgi:hypothetical protein
MDSGVSRSTCSWATSIAHLHQQGAGRRFHPNKEDPCEEVPHEENDGEAQKARRPPQEEQPRVDEEIRQEEKHVAHAAPTRK